ncbi:MAG TPA: hypothetical protein VEL11_08840 [Candidatus Bathyarchaeia archaeon]|nr:hypothetical protein [Candidatus Bathyarchaeia archaeon]
MNYLLEKGFEQKIDIIYIDPPFNIGEKFHRKKKLKTLRLKMCLGEISRRCDEQTFQMAGVLSVLSQGAKPVMNRLIKWLYDIS